MADGGIAVAVSTYFAVLRSLRIEEEERFVVERIRFPALSDAARRCLRWITPDPWRRDRVAEAEEVEAAHV